MPVQNQALFDAIWEVRTSFRDDVVQSGEDICSAAFLSKFPFAILRHIGDPKTTARCQALIDERTIHVAGAVHFDDAQTCVLLVVRAESAIERATAIPLRRKLKRNGAWFVELRGIGIHACVAVYEPFEEPVLRAAFPHVDLGVADQNLCVDDSAADGTDAARKFIENIIGIFLESCRAVSANDQLTLRL